MKLDRELLIKALNATDPQDLLDGLDGLTVLADTMAKASPLDPLNMALLRLLGDAKFMDKVKSKAELTGGDPEGILFSFLAGYMVGLLTPVDDALLEPTAREES